MVKPVLEVAHRRALFLAVLMSTAVLNAQRVPSSDFDTVYSLAMGAPPEIGARALLRLSTHIDDRKLRTSALEMAFRMAEKATVPMRLVAVPGTEVDTRTGSVGAALELGLDKLSLQSLAIQRIAPLDNDRSRQLFTALKRPQSPVLGCEAGLVPDISSYYDALIAVVARNPSMDEADISLITAALNRVSTVADIGGAARLLASVPLARRPMEASLGLFASRLGGIPIDSRSFVYFSRQIDSGIAALVVHARESGASTGALAEAYRNLLVAQFTGPHCADSSIHLTQPILPAHMFGAQIRGVLPPIDEQEMQSTAVDGEMKLNPYWGSAKAAQIFDQSLDLRSRWTAPDATQHTAEWESRLRALLAVLSSWTAGDEATEEDYYHQQATVYEALLEVVPNGGPAGQLLSGFVSFLNASPLQKHNPAEWYLQVRRALDRIETKRPTYTPSILNAYRASGNVMLMLEVLLEQLDPTQRAQATPPH